MAKLYVMINDKLGNICNTFNGNYFLNKKNFYKSLRKNIKLNEKKKQVKNIQWQFTKRPKTH